ncbi:MAG TPA: type II toxin-antitoxin system VapC family toxin [Candidatus Eremiobacteraceae bacterium]|nr:type II toxin-antitoxin system VapC family toxin [Candidatus Eremiobacteraceae bacterium]
MIIDTSAIVAILRAEPEAALFANAIADSRSRKVSAVSFVEAAAVIDASHDAVASRRFDQLFREARLVVEPVSFSQAQTARDAYRDFGKGSGHPAGLNLGDCFAYALAKESGEPLLFKGQDFSKTDVAAALP